MAYEVEMKAWVHDWERLEGWLRERCRFERSFRKEDRYFRAPQRACEDLPEETQLFRLRMDDGGACVTFKEKSVLEGMERNLEREFSVNDATAFLELMDRMGCREEFAKVKEGLHFSSGDLTVELVHVHELGDFLEVEFVHEEADDELHAHAASRIRTFFSEAGIPPDRIEPRPYMQMLRETRAAP